MTRNDAIALVRNETGNPDFAEKFVSAAAITGMLKLDAPKPVHEKAWSALFEYGLLARHAAPASLKSVLELHGLKIVEK
jgi:hypothetical protein